MNYMDDEKEIKKYRITTICVAILLVLVIADCFYCDIKHRQAIELMDNHKYDDAIETLDHFSVRYYLNNEHLIEQCRNYTSTYKKALTYVKKNEYFNALALFQTIPEYPEVTSKYIPLMKKCIALEFRHEIHTAKDAEEELTIICKYFNILCDTHLDEKEGGLK